MNLIEITNKTGKVKLTDAVTPWSVEKLTEDIGKLFGAKALENGVDFTALINAGGEALDELEIIINSPGGSIFDGYNVYNEIKSLQERGVVVTATVTGMCASMASVIAMACDVIRMVPHGRMMIHEASNGVHGNAEAHRKAAELLDGISNDIAVIYSNRTNTPVGEIRDSMKAETWMNAKESLKAGFIDSIYDPSTEKNNLDLNATNVHLQPNNEMSLLSKLLAPSNEEVIAQLESVKNDLADAESANSEFVSKLQTAETALQEAATEIQNLRASSTAFSADLAAATAENEAIKASLAEAEAKITPEAIQALVTAQIAGSGHPPLVIEPEENPWKEENTITRAEFSALGPYDQDAKLRAGYKITV
jgi:ATP-dependent protease ClpP protease subunit